VGFTFFILVMFNRSGFQEENKDDLISKLFKMFCKTTHVSHLFSTTLDRKMQKQQINIVSNVCCENINRKNITEQG